MPGDKWAQYAEKPQGDKWAQYTETVAPNAGLAPAAGPSQTMDSGEGPIAAGLTSFETQLSQMPKAIAGLPRAVGGFLNSAVHGFPEETAETERVMSGKEAPEKAFTNALSRVSPIAKVDAGTPNEHIDWGATGANLAPLLIDMRGGGITESPAGQVIRGAASPVVGRVLAAPIRAGARTIEAAANSKFRPLARLFTPADEALQAKIKIPGRDFGLAKAAAPEYSPEPGLLQDRLGKSQPTGPLDRLRNQELPPAQSDYVPARPSIERIMPAEGEGGIPKASPEKPQTPNNGATAYRSRSVGEEGIPHNPQSHAQATMSQPEAESFITGREQVTGNPQELIGVRLGETPGFSTRPGPRGADWVKFHGSVPESAVEKIPAANSNAISDALSKQLNESLGGRPLQPNVPLRSQVPGKASANLPSGFKPVESSALRGYKYNPATKEFEAITNNGQHYVHTDVSPEQAASFEAAESKGKAWNDLRKSPGVTLTKKGPMGNPQAVKPAELKTTQGAIPKSQAGMNPDIDLSSEWAEEVKRINAAKGKR